MKAITHSFRRPSLMTRLALCMAMMGLILMPTGAVAQVPVHGAGRPAPPEASPSAAARPLADLLNPDGTLNLATGFRGSVDARGWQLVSGPGEAPRFMPLSAPGDENWANHFGPPGTDNPVFALAVDGSGDLYVGGMFTTAGGVSANYVARWNGSSWSALGSGMNYWVRALADGVRWLWAEAMAPGVPHFLKEEKGEPTLDKAARVW